MLEFYWRIIQTTWQRQLFLVVISVSIALLAAVPLDLQRRIINNVVDERELNVLTQLCLLYALVALANGVLKFCVNYFGANLGERVIRTIRRAIYNISHNGGPPGQTKFSGKRGGTLVTMLSVEAESIGTFVGNSLSHPIIQIFTLISILSFMFYTDTSLAIVAVLIMLPQFLLVAGFQKYINRFVRHKTRLLRTASDRLIRDYDDGSFTETRAKRIFGIFDKIYGARNYVYLLKFSSKGLSNFFYLGGVAAILYFGGREAIAGDVEVGVIVAFLSGLARVIDPWRGLVQYFRTVNIVYVQYRLLMEILGRRPELIHTENGNPN